MCTSGLALHYPAVGHLLEYATNGCPTSMGKPWRQDEMQTAIEQGPHVSAMVLEAMEQLASGVEDKVRQGQAKVLLWDDVKDDPPAELKVSLIAMIPHKLRAFCAILDLSFSIRLAGIYDIPLVNKSSVKTASSGAIDQPGHLLMRITHAFCAGQSGCQDTHEPTFTMTRIISK